MKGWRTLAPYVRPHAAALVAASLLLAGHATLTLAVPRLLAVLVATDVAWAPDAVRGTLGVLAGVALGRFVCETIALGLLGRAAGGLARALRADAHARLVGAGLAYHDRTPAGDSLSRLLNDVTMLTSALAAQVPQAIRSLLLVLGGMAMLVTIDWRLALSLLALLMPAAAVLRSAGRAIFRASADVQARMADLAAVATEHFQAIHAIKGSGADASARAAFGVELDRGLDALLHRTRVQQRFQPASGALLLLAFAGMAWLGAGALASGGLPMPALASAMMYAGLVAVAGSTLATLLGDLQQARAAADRVREILDVPDDRGAGRTPAPSRGPWAVSFDGVSFAYADTLVLDGVSFGAAAGEIVAFTGGNGAGKSTVLKLLLQLWRPTSGRILLDGVDLATLDAHDVRGRVAYLPQEPALFRGTLRSNLAFGLAPLPDAALDDVVRAVGLADFVASLPAGYDTPVGERGATLSAGQRARVALARLLLKDAPLVLLDEPTAALDVDAVALVEKIVDTRLRGRTVLLVTHEPRLIARATRVIALQHGRVEAPPG